MLDQSTPSDDDLRAPLTAVVRRLKERVKARIDRRVTIENRWLEDLRHFHGVYTQDQLREIRTYRGSELFENQTRPKTNALAARLGDLLFPTDDRNWEIEPTPVPDLANRPDEFLTIASRARETKADAEARLQKAADTGAPETEQDAIATEAVSAEQTMTEAERAVEELEETMREARTRAQLMEAEIDDQLVTCRYGAEARNAIMDGCKIGTGILKGPVIGDRRRRRWQTASSESGFALISEEIEKPAALRCDPWHTFLDPDVRDQNEGEGVFQRHFYNARMMRKLATDPAMDQDAIRACLVAGPAAGDTPHFMPVLHDITGEGRAKLNDHFLVWEYCGPIDAEDLAVIAEAFGDDATISDIMDAEADPLVELSARIWFCQDMVLKFAIYPLDSGDSLYSVYNVEEDEVGPYGFGIPYLMRANQDMLNGAARMLMDNAGLGAGPQILIDREIAQPMDGDYTLRPRKMWNFNSRAALKTSTAPFQTFDIPIRQLELAAIMDMALKFIDDDTNLPKIAQGEQGVGITKTAQGMALLMNAANVVFKRLVKDWDDHVTVPLITRFYDWNMQFSDRDEIKGDYDVKPRGSSVLLVREMLSQNLILIAQLFGDHPKYGPRIDHDALLSEIFRAHQIPAGSIVKTSRQLEQDRKDAETNPPPEVQATMQLADQQKRANDLKEQELELKAELANLDADTRRYIADKTLETKMMEIETRANSALDKIDSQATDKADAAAIKAASDARAAEGADRRLAVEVAMREDTGVSAGGSV